jgi:hypothetical protein
MGGIPKFCLPLTDSQSLLEWHIERMRECCDRIRVCTRATWIPIIQQMQVSDVELIAIEPSTMSDALARMWMHASDRHVIGMPDTYIHESDGHFYAALAADAADVTLAAWPCHADLQGRVGQLDVADDGRVRDAKDKVAGCPYPLMWGAMAIAGDVAIDRTMSNPGLQLPEWVAGGVNVRAIRVPGTYMDVGTVSGLKMLYQTL